MALSRDILVMFRQQSLSESEMQREVSRLNKLLFAAERLENFVRAHEIFDINRYRILTSGTDIKKMIRQKKTGNPFIFFSNKN